MNTLIRTTFLPQSIEEAWDFFSNPLNLKTITPDYMGFEVTSKPQNKMYAGMIISYKVSPMFNIPMNWVTEISHVEEHKFFVDEQKIGPYKLWHHQHHFEAIKGGVRMTDIVNYKPPMGFIGQAMVPIFIKSKLNDIFNYRSKKIEELFGTFS